MYSILKKILFLFDPEFSHSLVYVMLKVASKLGVISFVSSKKISDPVSIMGLQFQNRVGLAAGLDKNGDLIDELGQLGFGFIEIGTITPVAQSGNPKPRLFRLVNEKAVINRMGFNNLGINHLLDNVKQRQYSGVLGINIGKNKATPEQAALLDYERCMDLVYEWADYITINISSPNTPGLRNLQFGQAFEDLLRGVKNKQTVLADKLKKYVPIAIKIAPDMSDEEIVSVAKSIKKHKLDAVIATNTTVGREGVESSRFCEEAGGLSGMPLKNKSTHVIRILAKELDGEIPIVGVGGIMSKQDAVEKIEAGASLIQIYSGFIFTGPKLIKEAAEAIALQVSAK